MDAREQRASITRPQRYLTRMIGFLVVAIIVVGAFNEPVSRAFFQNPFVNGLILAILALGVTYIFRQVLMLYPEVRWIETYRRAEPGLSVQRSPVLLAPMATMFSERPGRVSLSAMSMRSLLDSISSRLDESRDISRYLIGLLIFLGLLGTFWGLLETLNAVGGTIKGLSIEGDFTAQFETLRSGLEAPLAGMGTAFASSLFGLAGSLVLGFLDLQASQAQNHFYNDLEEWLSSVTRLSSGGGVGEGDQSVPAYVGALLEQTADSLGNLQRALARAEEERTTSQGSLLELADRLATLGDQMRSEQDLLVKLVETQMEMKPVLQRLAESTESGDGGDRASLSHLRSIDVSVRKLLEDAAPGRNELVNEMRSEIKLLARTIASLADEGRERQRKT